MELNAVQPSEQVRQFSFRLNGEVIKVISKPGLPEWDQLLPAAELLAANSRLISTDQVLLFGCHHGALAVYLARGLTEGKLSITDNNFTALEVTRKTLEANNISSVDILSVIDFSQTGNQKFTAAFIQLPKGRILTRRWLLQAYQALDIGGNFFIAGSLKTGIQSVIRDAMQVFGNGNVLAYKKGNRVSHLIKESKPSTLPDWVSTPGDAQGTRL